jgi:SAM-dependent methyltransferase
MGLTLIRVSLLAKMVEAGLVHGDGTDQTDEPFFYTGNERHDRNGGSILQVGTEDIYFCHKAKQVGAKILVDTSVLGGHHDKASGTSYGLPWHDGPWRRGKWLLGPDGKHQDVEEASAAGLKLALDIGAGGERRTWEGYKTYTTDIRKDSNPDYVQDTRKLNLPDEHFDLVASSHHLEHIGRWDQESVWREMFRITKPGGTFEHTVPDVSWAAAKISNGQYDEHVLNVLYGAQESHGYEREFNLHYFGYTPEVGIALAEKAGYVDVTATNWKQQPELGYNLILKGTRPIVESGQANQAA